MGKVIDTAGEKIAETGSPATGHDILGPAPAPLASPERPVEPAKTITPARTAAIVAFSAAMIGGFGLLYAQGLQSGSRVEARMARVDQLDERFDALIAKLDAVGTRLDAVGTRLQAMGNKLDGLGSQVSTGLRDANRNLSETLNTSFNALSQRLTAQQQQQQREQREQREKEQKQQQSSPPRSSSTAPDPFSPYSPAPGSARPRRAYP
jgi:hypothetical protein